MAERQQQAQQFIDALHALETGTDAAAEQISALFSDDAVLTNAALNLVDKEYTGREGVREFWQAYRGLFADIYSEFAHVTSDTDAAGLFWTSKGTYADGKPVEYDGVSLLVFGADDKISRFRGYYDTRQLSRTVEAD